MKPLRLHIAVLSFAVLLTGCAGQTVPAERFYRLQPVAVAAGADTPSTPVIAIAPVEVHGVYVETALLYRSSRANAPLQQYPYASWAEPPDVMIADVLVAELRAAFGALRVRAPGQRGAADIRVAVSVHGLEQIRDGDKARAYYAATYTATDRDGRLLFVMDWKREAPAAGPSPLEFVAALNGLISQANHAAIEKLRSSIGAAAPAASS